MRNRVVKHRAIYKNTPDFMYRTYPLIYRTPEHVYEFMDRKRAQWALDQPEVTE